MRKVTFALSARLKAQATSRSLPDATPVNVCPAPGLLRARPNMYTVHYEKQHPARDHKKWTNTPTIIMNFILTTKDSERRNYRLPPSDRVHSLCQNEHHGELIWKYVEDLKRLRVELGSMIVQCSTRSPDVGDISGAIFDTFQSMHFMRKLHPSLFMICLFDFSVP